MIKKRTLRFDLDLSKKNIYLQYTIIYLLMTTVVFAMFIIYNKSVLWANDGMAVNYIKQVDLRQTISQIFTTKSVPFWSWEIGLGSDIIGNYNSMAFIDPINILCSIIPVPATDYACALAIFIKLYLAGIFYICFMNEMNIKRYPALLSSVCYVFSGWIIKAAVHQDFFIEGAVLFPLLLWGVERVLKKKAPSIFIIATALLLICTPYHAFMSAVITFFYLILRLYEMRKNNNNYKIVPCLVKFIIYAVIAVFISAIFLFPVIYSMLNSAEDPISHSYFNLYNFAKYYLKVPIAFVTLEGGGGRFSNYSAIGVSVICLFMLPVMIKIRRTYGTLFRILIICFLTFLIPGLSMILNGFRYPTNRWMFIFVFFLAYMTAVCLNHEDAIQRKDIRNMRGLLYFIFLWSLFAGFFYTGKIADTGIVWICVIVLIGNTIISCLASINEGVKYKRNRSKVFALVCLNIVIINNLYFAPNVTEFFKEEKDINEIRDGLNNSPQKAVTQLNSNEDFFRVDSIEGMRNNVESLGVTNESIYFNYNPVYSFMPGKDKDWDTFNQALLISSNLKSRPSCSSNDNRIRIDTLLGVKYFVGQNHNNTDNYKYTMTPISNANSYAGYGFEKKQTIDKVDILQNKYSIGLGTVYNSYMLEQEFFKLSHLEREQALMQNAVITDRDLNKMSGYNIEKNIPTVNTKSIPYTIDGNIKETKKFKVEKETKTIKLKIDKVENSEIYVYIENMCRTPFSIGELQKIKSRNKKMTTEELLNFQRDNKYEDQYSNFTIDAEFNNVSKRLYNSSNDVQGIDAHDFMVNLGYYKETDGTISLTVDNTGEYKFDSIEVIAVPMDSYDEQAEKLVNNKMEVKKISGNGVTGYINNSRDGILYLSIIHNDGWRVYIDGKKEDTIKTNIGFTGVPVTAGKHDIKLVYRPYGFEISCLLTIIGTISFIILFFSWRRKKNSGGQNAEKRN